MDSGQQLDLQLSRKHRPDLFLLLLIGILVLLGLIIIYAISPALAARINAGGFDLSQNHFFYRHLIYIGVGLTAFFVASMVPITFWAKTHGKLLAISVVIATLPVVLQATPVGLCANGACRWLDLGFFSFQPAELVKLALVVYLAGFLALKIKQGLLNDVKATLIPIGVILGVIAVIIVGLQKDLGTGLTIFAIVMSMLFIAGVASKYLVAAIGASVAAIVVFIVIAPHRIERIMTFFGGHENVGAESMGYHINQALIAIGSGGFTGRGLGQSIQAFGYLPEAANDSIFAIMAEIFGFLGTVVVLAVFAALVLRLINIVLHSAHPYLRLIVAGVFGWIFAHIAVNIGAMLGIFPLTGITLPFVSFGGTSLLFILIALGLVFQISRYTTHQITNQEGSVNGYTSSRRRVGRTHNTGIKRP